MTIVGIVNPVAGRGESAKVWARVSGQLKDGATSLETKAPGHAIELTRRAIKDGARVIVAAGGDGTIHEVVNGFFEDGELISDAVMLGILPHGTGSDLQRTLGLPEDSVIHGRNPRTIDLMKVRYTTFGGAWASRFSINMTSFGMGGMVASRVNRSAKVFGGKLSFVLATLRTAATFAGNRVTIRPHGSDAIESNVTNVCMGNGQYHGGGMLACPRAAIDDGFFDITVIDFMRLPELVRNLRLLYNGEIYTHPKVRFFRAAAIRADSIQPTLLEIDGEPLGRLPVEISIVPRAIRILA